MMSSPTVDLVRELRARGYRLTPARRAVWDVLSAADEHLTAEAVVQASASAGRPVGRASVYRTLDLLEELGLARRARLGDAAADRWEVVHPDDLFHVTCAGCGRVDHHAGELVALIEQHLAQSHAFEVQWVELQVIGTCAGCSGRTAPA